MFYMYYVIVEYLIVAEMNPYGAIMIIFTVSPPPITGVYSCIAIPMMLSLVLYIVSITTNSTLPPPPPALPFHCIPAIDFETR